MSRFRAWIHVAALLPAMLLALLLSLLFAACNQGTEVGNPEVTLTARFALMDTAADASIQEMNLKVMGMGWAVGADTAYCWNNPEGRMVDFAEDGSPMAPVKVRDAEWSNAEMLLQAPAGDSALPDTSAFADWSNPRYTKLTKAMGGDSVRCLFEMPAGLKLKLMFDKATIKSWRKDHSLEAGIRFDVGKWAAGLGQAPAFKYREDGKHSRYVLLSPVENAEAWQGMIDMLPKAFMADTVEMQ